MLALVQHRSSAYLALRIAREKLFQLKKIRSGLFIEKRSNPFFCKAVLDLLADIAAAKFEALRLLLSLDMFERALHGQRFAKKQKRIWLGSRAPANIPETKTAQAAARHKRHRHDGLKAYLFAVLLRRAIRKPTP